MNIHHVLFFCFFSALCDGNTRLVGAKLNIYAGAEGETASISCYLTLQGSRKFFCKNQCKAEDILVKTEDVRARSGRYITEYKSSTSGRGKLSVTITDLIKSDSGRYRCGLGKTLVPESYSDFEIRVLDAALLAGKSGLLRAETEGGEITKGCSNTVYGRQKFLCKDKCKNQDDILIETEGNQAQNGRYSIEYKEGSIFGLYVIIKQVTKLDTGRYRCGYGTPSSPDSYDDFHVIVVDASVPSTSTPTTTTTTTPSPTPTTQSQSSSSTGFTPPVSLEATDQLTGYSLPLVVCVPLASVVLAVFLLLLYKWRTRRNTRGNADTIYMEASAIYENLAPVSPCEDAIYENLHPVSKDEDQTYCTV